MPLASDYIVVGMLGITTDENWKDFAKHLGFTKREIKDKLGNTGDPFALIMGVFQARGGKEGQLQKEFPYFVKAL